MGERDRFQSQYDRERGRYDYDDENREQRRTQPREWYPREEYQQRDRDRDRYSGYYSERQFGSRGVDEREQGSRYGSEEQSRQGGYRNEPRYESSRRYGDQSAYSNYDREREQRYGRYGAGEERSYGSYGSSSFPRSYEDSSLYIVGSSYGSPYNTQQEPYRGAWEARGRQRDWQSNQQQQRGQDDESFGQQLREAGQRIARSVKRVFRGPKGYKRSDDRIREDVSDRLGEHEYLDCSEIEVSVSNGEVTLTGSVNTRQEKFLAEEIADDISGVNDVHNQIRVKREQSSMGTTETTSSVGTQAGSEAARTRNARA